MYIYTYMSIHIIYTSEVFTSMRSRGMKLYWRVGMASVSSHNSIVHPRASVISNGWLSLLNLRMRESETLSVGVSKT